MVAAHSIATYDFVVYSPTGFRLGRFDVYDSAQVTVVVNSFGSFTIVVPSDRYPDAWFLDDVRIEVWRKPYGAQWYLLGNCQWLTRAESKTAGRVANKKFRKLTALQATWFLKGKLTVHPAGIPTGVLVGGADTLMKNIFTENCIAPADATRSNATIVACDPPPTASTAYIVRKMCAWRNMLQLFQEMSQETLAGTIDQRVYFDMVGGIEDGKITFRTFQGARGMNRTVGRPLILSERYGTLMVDDAGHDATDAVTRTFAGGRGRGLARQVANAIDTKAYRSPFAMREMFIEPSGSYLTADLEAECRTNNKKLATKTTFRGTVLSKPGNEYGVAWAWGDRVLADVEGTTYSCMIDSVTITVKKDSEDIQAELRVED